MSDAYADRALATLADLRADIAKLEEQFSAVERERDALRAALAWIDNHDPALVAAAEERFGAALEAKP